MVDPAISRDLVGEVPAGKPTDPASRAPDDRGRLKISDHVVERVAMIAASEIGGVVSTGTGFDQILGRRYPKADASVARGRTRIQVDIAIAWPHALADVSAQVRQRVRERVSDLVGLTVDAVDVTASKVVHASQPEQRRVQ